LDVETDYLFRRPGLGTVAKLVSAGSLARRLLRGRFDALIAYQPTASILVGLVGGMKGCRFRIVHQTSMPDATAWPVRLADRLVGQAGLYTLNVANSIATHNAFAGYPRSYRRALSLIEHGLDPPLPARVRAETRRRFQLPVTEPCILNVGRMTEQKNQRVLVCALAHLPAVHLAVAGDGPEAASLRALATDLGLEERLHLLGSLPPADIADLYFAADLFVFPSRWETFGLAAVEAAMAGLPMVVADLAVLREVLRTTIPAPVAFVPISDDDGWVQAIRTALLEPAQLGQRRSFAEEVGRRYSKQRMIDAYLGLLRVNDVVGTTETIEAR
jgi:glycosyltransferase involved in cell wall biosynthesis